MTNIDAVDPPRPEKKTEDKPKLIAVEFLDGDDDTGCALNSKQWVNLPREDKWVDGKYVTNKDRLGQKLRIKVRFDKKGSHKFKLKLKQDPENVVYSGKEQQRNANFKYEEAEKSYTTDADGTKIVTDFFINAGGNNEWTAVGKDDQGNEVESHKLTAARLVYLVIVTMKDVPAADSLAQLFAEYARHGIVLEVIDRVEIPQKTYDLTTEGSNALLKSINSRYKKSKGPKYAPYTICACFVGHTVSKSVGLTQQQTLTAGPDAKPVSFTFSNHLSAGELWKDLAPDEDDWFVSCVFTPAEPPDQRGKAATRGMVGGVAAGGALGFAVGSAPGAAIGGLAGGVVGSIVGLIVHKEPEAPAPIPIPKEKCKPEKYGYTLGFNKVTIAVDELPKLGGTLTLTYNATYQWNAGVALGDTNIIATCTRVRWSPESNSTQNQTMIHELGHAIWMVSDGKGKKPDKVPTFYEGKDHVGPHCHYGLPEMAGYLNASGAQCVMFGQGSDTLSYCQNCSPAVLKVDLSPGWQAVSSR